MVNIAKAKKIQGNPGSGIYFKNSFWVAIAFIIFSWEILLCTSQVMCSCFCKYRKHGFGWCCTFATFSPYFNKSLDSRKIILCRFCIQKSKQLVILKNLFFIFWQFLFCATKLWCAKSQYAPVIIEMNCAPSPWDYVCYMFCTCEVNLLLQLHWVCLPGKWLWRYSQH